ncbi:MAG: phage tail assembly protein [Rhodospirillales bacterium]|nr:phage tail assembly protein [Rhodospirillales bacterium]
METDKKTQDEDKFAVSVDPETGKTKVPLQYPATVASETLSEVLLRRPKGRDLAAIDEAGGGENQQTMTMISQLCDIPPSFVREMDAVDIKRLALIIAGFMGTSPQTGGT